MPRKPLTVQSPDSLERIARRWESITLRLRETAEAMKAEEITEIECGNFDSMTRAFDFSTNFEAEVRKAFDRKMVELGRYQGQPASKPRGKGK